MRRIKIIADSGVEMTAELNDSNTADSIWQGLPIHSVVQRWGEEVYFDIRMQLPPEDARPDAPPGTIAYWPTGNALCIFFGQTPYSPVNIVGKLDGDPNKWDDAQGGEFISVEREE